MEIRDKYLDEAVDRGLMDALVQMKEMAALVLDDAKRSQKLDDPKKVAEFRREVNKMQKALYALGRKYLG